MAFPQPKKGRVSITKQELLKAAKEFASNVIDNPEYRAAFLRRAIAGQLPAALEILLYHYKFGKPADQITLELPKLDGEEIAELTDEQLADRAERLARAIRSGRKFQVVAGTDTVQ